MSDALSAMRALSSAEEFFDLLGVPYDPAVLRVTRLHVLKRFHQYLEAAEAQSERLDSAGQVQVYRSLLLRAYEDFIRSTPAREKVFKVFRDADDAHFGLDRLRRSLPSRSAP